MDFILTWVKHLVDLEVSNFLVGKLSHRVQVQWNKNQSSYPNVGLGAMDTKLLEALYWKGVPVFDMGSHMSTVDVGWGTPTFHKMGREKVILIYSFLPFGYELLMCDTDMVWLKVVFNCSILLIYISEMFTFWVISFLMLLICSYTRIRFLILLVIPEQMS